MATEFSYGIIPGLGMEGGDKTQEHHQSYEKAVDRAKELINKSFRHCCTIIKSGQGDDCTLYYKDTDRTNPNFKTNMDSIFYFQKC